MQQVDQAEQAVAAFGLVGGEYSAAAGRVTLYYACIFCHATVEPVEPLMLIALITSLTFWLN